MTEREHPQQPVAPLLRAAFGAQTAQVLYVAAKLALADHLYDSPQTPADLARVLDIDARALERVLRGLVSLGVCEEIDGTRFALTSLGEYLRTDHSDSIQPRIILNTEVHAALWADLLATMKTGESASQRVFGMPFYDYLARHTAVASLFDRTMTSAGWLRHRLQSTVEAYDFGQFATIVDIGGGNGRLLVELLKTYTSPRGTVFDVPRLAEAARQTIEAARLSARCQFLSGDAFEAVPAGGDAYVLSNFVNSFGDDETLGLLRNVRKAIALGGKLLLIDWVMPIGDEPKDAFLYWDTVTMDLIMLAAFGSRGGYVRTRPQFEALLNAAGFKLSDLIPTRASVWVIEAVRV